MTGEELREVRKGKRWTQVEVAKRLGVTQAYLSMLESGVRVLPNRLAREAAELLDAPATTLPLRVVNFTMSDNRDSSERVHRELAGLGYPGFVQGKRKARRNPAEVVLGALNEANLEPRVVEGLPWLVARYSDMDWDWLVKNAKLTDRQNRLGFVTTVASQLAENSTQERMPERAKRLREYAGVLERSKLVREDTLCRDAMTQAERKWLRENRPVEAGQWNLLTDMKVENLAHAQF
jgi:transcriptional regulator with XRE-family HTH domain